MLPKAGELCSVPKAGVLWGVLPNPVLPNPVLPKAGVELAPNRGEGDAPKAGVLWGVPKAGVDEPKPVEPKAGVLACPKAGVLLWPNAGVAPNAGRVLPNPELQKAGVEAWPKAGVLAGVPKPVEPKGWGDVAPKPPELCPKAPPGEAEPLPPFTPACKQHSHTQ